MSITQDCDNPIVGGYTGRAVLIPWADGPTVTASTTNPRIISAVTAATTIAVDNTFPSAFNGSSTASGSDSGMILYTKSFTFVVPRRGGDVSKDLIEPLMSDQNGFLAIIEKKDKTGDGTYEVVGLKSPLTTNADGITRDESTNNGAISVTMSCSEVWFECSFFTSDYSTSKTAFEALLAKGL